jgi:hypothetical protein
VTLKKQALPTRYKAAYIAVIGSGILLLFAARYLPPGSPFFPECIFRSMTGIKCPSCGLTTSIVCAAHGDLAGSFYAHPFGIAAMALAAASVMLALYGLILGSKLEWLFGKWLTMVVGMGIVLYIIDWLLRTK